MALDKWSRDLNFILFSFEANSKKKWTGANAKGQGSYGTIGAGTFSKVARRNTLSSKSDTARRRHGDIAIF